MSLFLWLLVVVAGNPALMALAVLVVKLKSGCSRLLPELLL